MFEFQQDIMPSNLTLFNLFLDIGQLPVAGSLFYVDKLYNGLYFGFNSFLKRKDVVLVIRVGVSNPAK